MLDEQTLQKMREMKMNAMAQAFEEVLEQPSSNKQSFAERVALMVDREWTARENRRLTRLLRAAKLTHDATLEDVWTTQGRGVTKTVVRDLATCRWITNRNNVICVGKTGCGKSYFAAALAQAARRSGSVGAASASSSQCSRQPRVLPEVSPALPRGMASMVGLSHRAMQLSEGRIASSPR